MFFNGAKPCDKEEDYTEDTSHKVSVTLRRDGDNYTVETDMMQYLPNARLITTETLGEAFEPEERFENPDGSDIVFDTDFYGKKRGSSVVAGPFAG